jgi:hypothetical protein
MKNTTVEQEARMYVYDLDNRATELGFKTDENWSIRAVGTAEKAVIEKQYYPTVSVKASPEKLVELFNLVKAKITYAKPGFAAELEMGQSDMEYLVAYNTQRPVR